MGSNKNLFILLGLAVVALVATVMSGAFNIEEEPDFAQQLSQQRGGNVTSTPAPAAVPPTPAENATSPATTTPEATPAEAASGEEAAADVEAGNPCDEGSTPVDGDATETVASAGLDGDAETAAATEGEEADDLGLDVEGLDSGAEEEAAPSDDDLFLEDEVSDDPIERFKDMDPRDIIDAKYLDLEGRLTTPWNEDDPENYIPWTGRPDPLTPIREAIPEELMPSREGDLDDSQIQLYAASIEASAIVEQVSRGLRCENVLQIGLRKYASFSGILGQISLSEGESRGWGFSVEGVNGSVNMVVISIADDLVVVNFSATADLVDLGISKTQHFIPAKGF